MGIEQAIVYEAIAKAVAEATTAVIQVMAAATTERPQHAAGPQIGRPAMKRTTFNWEADNKYIEPKHLDEI